MRVIAGTLGGRQFQSPGGHRTHPMSEKMRGAMFGVLGDIKGLTVLDPFAGSGALGFEAVSRGAKSALLLDKDKLAASCIEANIASLGLEDQVTGVQANALSWSKKNYGTTYDLILADPPYDRLPFAPIERLAYHLAPKGVYVLSWPAQYEVARLKGLEIVSQKQYGDAQLVFFRHIQ